MKITVENRMSKKGTLYSVVVLKSLRGDKFLSFDPEICATLSGGLSFGVDVEGTIVEFELKENKI